MPPADPQPLTGRALDEALANARGWYPPKSDEWLSWLRLHRNAHRDGAQQAQRYYANSWLTPDGNMTFPALHSDPRVMVELLDEMAARGWEWSAGNSRAGPVVCMIGRGKAGVACGDGGTPQTAVARAFVAACQEESDDAEPQPARESEVPEEVREALYALDAASDEADRQGHDALGADIFDAVATIRIHLGITADAQAGEVDGREG